MRDHPRPHPEARELDECVQAAWLDFLARELRLADPRLEGRRPSDLRAVHIADGFFRTAFDDGGPVDLDDVVRHARAIFDNPLRTLYPILFPRDKPRRAGEGGATYRFEDLSYGVRIRDRQREVFICNQFDIELLSAALDSHGEVNPWSIKALSLRPHEFLYLAPDDQANVRTIFNSRFFLQATELREAHLDPELPPPVTHGLRKLAAFPLFLANVSTNGCGPQGLLDFVPDLAYQACCDAHDTCYARGGTERDRARCDEELARCIEAIGGGALQPGGFIAGFVGTLYYVFVTVFGPPAFSYGGGSDPPKDAEKTGQGGGAVGARCSYVVKLRDISFRNAPSGGRTLELEVTPDFERQIRTNPGMLRKLKFPEIEVKGNGTRRFSTDPIQVTFGESACGATIRVNLLVKDLQEGVGNEEDRQFVCDGSTYRFTTSLSVDRVRLGFNFEVETSCR